MEGAATEDVRAMRDEDNAVADAHFLRSKHLDDVAARVAIEQLLDDLGL